MRGTRAQEEALVTRLARAGFPDARDEVRMIIDASPDDPGLWQSWVDRRRTGEPLEWIVGFTTFMGHRVRVDRGVYVPRRQTELVARRAVDALPCDGTAADLCTGSGAIAVALQEAWPGTRVVATDIDAAACQCAESNGVEVYQGHLAEPIPAELIGTFDVVVAVVPYVPGDEMIFLPRDVRDHEPHIALDGGVNGTERLEQVVTASTSLLRPGGSLILELGGNQDEHLAPALEAGRFELVERVLDEDGDLRGMHARLAS